MSNILNFPNRRSQQARAHSIPLADDGISPQGQLIHAAERLHKVMTDTSTPAEKLEQSLDAHRSTVLELAHRREQFALQMRMEENTAQIRLEAAAYKAMLAGVPESDIYALGEDMAEALHSAMDTVAGA